MVRYDQDPESAGGEGDLEREMAWLHREVAAAAGLTDAERVAILEDLFQTSEAIRAGKTPDELRQEEAVRVALDRPGRERYRALAERIA
jgi:hypothetical protein